MKTEFLKFQVSKEAMNYIKGGDVFSCKCGNGKVFTSAEPPTAQHLVNAIDSVCGESGGSCTRN